MQSTDIPAERRAELDASRGALPPQPLTVEQLREVWYINHLRVQEAAKRGDKAAAEQARGNMRAAEAEAAGR